MGLGNYDPFGMRDILQEQKEFRNSAKQDFVNGIDPADLKAGMRVTISPNLRTGDRSYCTEALGIVAVNACHAQLKFLNPRGWGADTVIIVLAEHHIYSADGFAIDEGSAK